MIPAVRDEAPDLRALASAWRTELFHRVLPFWEGRGFDHTHGGFFHRLGYDGSLLGDEKHLWFQGRGLWVWSFLYNHFGRDAARLEIARRTRDFLLAHAPQPDGWWARVLSRDGRALEPFSGELYGMFFAAEGLLEYAAAVRDDEAHAKARELLERIWRRMHERGFGPRPQGLWMLSLRIATQMLRRESDALAKEMADEALDAILERHYNPEIGLNNEVLAFDFSRPPGEESKCVFGHCIECLWMAMDEADRRGDRRLWELCAGRLRRHLDAGWDYVFGGLVHAVNVDHPTYEWPEEELPGTAFRFRAVGEYNYLKSLWAINEVIVATLAVYIRTGHPWAARYLAAAEQIRRERFSLERLGYPTYMLFTDRRFRLQPHGDRQDNYHLPRQLMLGLLMLDEAAGTGGNGVA